MKKPAWNFTWKSQLSIFTALIALSLIVNFLRREAPHSIWKEAVYNRPRVSISVINFYFSYSENQDSLSFHLDPANSDFEANSTILNSLIGTLVKTSATGKITPYLANSYEVSDDQKVWTYNIRENISCEDGTPINAESYVKSLSLSLQSYAKRTDPIDFANLEGWHEFAAGRSNTIKGLKSEGNSVVFRFAKAPEALNELLRMPYFGFWCPENFQNGVWKRSSRPLSSGPYRLHEESTPTRVIIEQRADWFSITDKSPKKVNFQYAKPEDILAVAEKDAQTPVVIQSISSMNWSSNFDSYTKIEAIPSSLIAIVVNPNPSSGLDDVRLRQLVARGIAEKKPVLSKNPSAFFYMTGASEVDMPETSTSPGALTGKLLRLPIRGKSKSERVQKIEHHIRESIESLGGKLEVVHLDPADPNVQKKMQDPHEFDLRLVSVGVGGHFLNVAIKMIFCTRMGVSFPDPSGRICELVKNHDEVGGPVGPEYVRKFNQILVEDASVIPLSHHGPMWLFSKSLDEKAVSPVSEFPNIEDLCLK